MAPQSCNLDTRPPRYQEAIRLLQWSKGAAQTGLVDILQITSREQHEINLYNCV